MQLQRIQQTSKTPIYTRIGMLRRKLFLASRREKRNELGTKEIYSQEKATLEEDQRTLRKLGTTLENYRRRCWEKSQRYYRLRSYRELYEPDMGQHPWDTLNPEPRQESDHRVRWKTSR